MRWGRIIRCIHSSHRCRASRQSGTVANADPYTNSFADADADADADTDSVSLTDSHLTLIVGLLRLSLQSGGTATWIRDHAFGASADPFTA